MAASPEPRASRRAQPRAHWILLALLASVMASVLALEGYAHHAVGRSATGRLPAEPLAQLTGAGPVLDLSGRDVRSSSGDPGTVALTFDDGPDAVWTPRILAVLQRHQVPATFFVVGSRVLAHPGIVRAEWRAGDELGSHTFVHADVSSIAGWHTNLELSLTQSALAATVGVHTALFRPPYSSGTDAVSAADFHAWRAIARQGYLVVLSNRDSEDWKRPGVDHIVAAAQPVPGQGTVVMLHDGGGDRSQTVVALDELITSLQQRGVRFTTVSDLVGLPRGAVDSAVPSGQRLQGLVVASGERLGGIAVSALEILLVLVGILMLLRCMLLVAFARHHARRVIQPRATHVDDPVSVIVPAYNEAVGIGRAVRSLAASDYAELEVIVVDDGSSDATADIVESLGLANVRVLRQANAGKAAALNRGLAAARHDLIVTVDADTVFEPGTVRALVQGFADPSVGAVSGNTKVGNRRGLLGRWQHIEYVMGFNLDRRMYDVLSCMPTVPGAVGAFRRVALEEIGGVSGDTLAEDTDVTMAIGRAGWKVVYAEDAVAWTEAPARLSELWKQRYRWCYGTLQAMWKHRRSVVDGGPLGRRALPYLFVFQVVLPVLAPVIDVLTVFGIFFLRPAPLVTYWLAFNLVGLGLAAFAFRLDGEPLGPLWSFPLQQLVYRQLMYLVVIQSAVTAGLGVSLRWHKLQRTGDMAPV